MLTVNFTCTRPDTSVPFYHDSVQAADSINFLTSLRNSVPGVNYSSSMSEDGLTYLAAYIFDDASIEVQFTTALLTQYPSFLTDRDEYYSLNGHILISQII